jgi:DNA-damage-inducible protein D
MKFKWYFSIDDVVEVLTGSANVKDYLKKLGKRDPKFDGYWGTDCPLVTMPGADARIRSVRAAHAEGLFRIEKAILKRYLTDDLATTAASRSLGNGMPSLS